MMRCGRVGLLLVSLLLARPAAGHEMGAGRVEATFLADGTYRIDVRIDPETTLRRLSLAAGDEAPTEGLSLPALEDRLLARRDQLLAAMTVRFDDRTARSRLELLALELASSTPAATPTPTTASGSPAADAAPSPEQLLRQLEAQPGVEAVLRLSGDMPPAARNFTWRYALPATAYALILRDERHDLVATQWLDADATSQPFDLGGTPPARLDVARQYLVLGFTHIVPKGLDHILFVLGIFLLSTRIRPVLIQVTAFTVAHTLTLGLSIYGIVSLPSSVVEPLIALSIVYVAIENVLARQLSRWRVAVVFAFGLLHGLGFAGVLEALGLPRAAFAIALAAFNVGVELGQLAVIGVAFLMLASWSRHQPWYRSRIVIPASLGIAAVGLFWTLQRVLT